jgi:hypothetical protein
MGLTIVVGILAGTEDEDVGHVHAHFAVIRELLDRAGAGQWAEPVLNERDVLEADMGGYSGLHTDRRVAVHMAGRRLREIVSAWRKSQASRPSASVRRNARPEVSTFRGTGLRRPVRMIRRTVAPLIW